MSWVRNWTKDWTDTWSTGFMPGGGNAVPNFGLRAWYKTDKPSYLTLVSTAITQFLDQSGNNNSTTVQGTAAKRPTSASAQLNTLSTATLDGGDTLAMPSPLYAITNGANTIFVVAKRNTEDGATANIISMGDSAIANRLALSFNSTAGEILYRNDAGAGSSVTLTGNVNTRYSLLRASFNGITGLSISVNGGTAITSTTGALNNTTDRAYIGSRSDTDLYLTGGVAEILIYNRLLLAAEILQIEVYLADKWGLYHPSANWISAYSSWQQMLIHAWKINKDDAFTNTTLNPFAAIYDPSIAALGSTTSLVDTGRGINIATEATNPPVNTASGIGTANGLLYNGTTTILNAGSAASIDDIFAAGGCFIGVIKPTTIGEGSAGRIFDKTNIRLQTVLNSGATCKLQMINVFSGTTGDWQLTNFNVGLTSANIIAATYSAAAAGNVPTIYVNSLTAKAVTTNTASVGTATSDAAASMYLGNDSTSARTFDGYIGKMLFLKSVPTTAQLTSVFNFLATEYGVTLT